MIQIWGVDDIAFKVEDIAAKMHGHAEPAGEDEGLLQGSAGRSEGLKQDDVDRVLRDASRALSAASERLEESAAAQASANRRRAREKPKASSGRSR